MKNFFALKLLAGNSRLTDKKGKRTGKETKDEDGSLTEALYQIKPDCVDLIK